jgi:hypothetical protein
MLLSLMQASGILLLVSGVAATMLVGVGYYLAGEIAIEAAIALILLTALTGAILLSVGRHLDRRNRRAKAT